MWLNRPQRGEGASPQVREGGGGEGGGFFQKHLHTPRPSLNSIS